MSRNVVEKYVDHLIQLGTVKEKDRLDLETVFAQTTNGMESNEIDSFFAQMEAERIKKPDLFDSKKGIQLEEIKQISISISQSILDFVDFEHDEEKKSIFVADAKKAIFAITYATDSVEVIQKRIEATFPNISERDAQTIANEIKHAKAKKEVFDNLRDSEGNTGRPTKEIISEMFDGDEIEAARFASALAKDLFFDLASGDEELSEERAIEIERDLEEIGGMVDIPTEGESNQQEEWTPIEEVIQDAPKRVAKTKNELIDSAAKLSLDLSKHSYNAIKAKMELDAEGQETVEKIGKLARREAQKVLLSEEAYQAQVYLYRQAFIRKVNARVVESVNSLVLPREESLTVKKEDLMSLVAAKDVGRADVRGGFTGAKIPEKIDGKGKTERKGEEMQ